MHGDTGSDVRASVLAKLQTCSHRILAVLVLLGELPSELTSLAVLTTTWAFGTATHLSCEKLLCLLSQAERKGRKGSEGRGMA